VDTIAIAEASVNKNTQTAMVKDMKLSVAENADTKIKKLTQWTMIHLTEHNEN
jgi:hypothetical protein